MQGNNISILSTIPLAGSLAAEAKAAGISIDAIAFIATEPVQTIEVQQEIEQALLQSATVVFTSANAVEAVVSLQEDLQPNWAIYCIGNTTRQLVQKYFGEGRIAGSARSATDLAELIAEENDTDEVLFFCGNRRRDELPDILRSNDMQVNEIVVYETIATPHKVEKTYNGILFFSPSAVNSFFKNNQLSDQTILFAIGSTTASEIRKYTNNKIIISDEPGKGNLVKQVMEYFS